MALQDIFRRVSESVNFCLQRTLFTSHHVVVGKFSISEDVTKGGLLALGKSFTLFSPLSSLASVEVDLQNIFIVMEKKNVFSHLKLHIKLVIEKLIYEPGNTVKN